MNEEKGEKNERRESLLQLQFLDGQIKQLEAQLEQIEEQIFEVNIVIDNISQLKSTKFGDEALVPVANGIFLKTKIEDTENLKVNIGAGVVIEKTTNETIEMLKEQIKNIETYKDEMFMQLQTLVSQASMIQAKVVGEK